MATETPHLQKTKLLNAAQDAFRSQGYADTTVDDICKQAGVTKGSFFHHFKSKEDMTVSAIEQWNAMTNDFFLRAPYHELTDPLDRLLGYLDFRSQMIQGSLSDFTCLLGTLVQETYGTYPRVREACDSGLKTHIATIVRDVEAAKAIYCPEAPWDPVSVGNFIQAVLQGSFVLAKADGNSTVVKESLEHLKSYLRSLFSMSTADESNHDCRRGVS